MDFWRGMGIGWKQIRKWMTERVVAVYRRKHEYPPGSRLGYKCQVKSLARKTMAQHQGESAMCPRSIALVPATGTSPSR